MTATTIGIDIGGSSVKAGVRDERGRIVERYESELVSQGGRQVTAAAVEAFRSLASAGCFAVGVGVPGQVEPATGNVSLAVNLGIDGPFDLGSRIADEVGLPVVVENDVRVAALGVYESLETDANPPASLTVVNIGTGISAGVVVDGTVLRGAHGMAGEVGHVVVDESGPLCVCGQRGCLEVVASGRAIGKAWPKGDSDKAATVLFRSAAAGDPAAIKVAARITAHITTALTWLAAAYDTELVVLTGGVSSAGDDFLRVVRDQVAQQAAHSELAARRLAPEQIVLVDPVDHPGTRGAARLAFKLFNGGMSPADNKSKQTAESEQIGGAV